MSLPTHVRFAHPDAGYQAEVDNAAKALKAGQVYTLRSLTVGRSSSDVELYGVRGRFGAQMFEPAEPGEPRLTDDDLRVIARLVRESLRDSEYVLTFPPEDELRLKQRAGVQRVRSKIAAIRAARKPPPPSCY